MDQADPTKRDPSEDIDVAVAIWGDAPPSKFVPSPDAASTDIWGRPAMPARPDDDDPDPAVRWPDVWGDQEGWRSPPEGIERRHGPLPGGTDRFTRPEWWAAPPKPKSNWRQRLHRK
jgi:hypothetical protein